MPPFGAGDRRARSTARDLCHGSRQHSQAGGVHRRGHRRGRARRLGRRCGGCGRLRGRTHGRLKIRFRDLVALVALWAEERLLGEAEGEAQLSRRDLHGADCPGVLIIEASDLHFRTLLSSSNKPFERRQMKQPQSVIVVLRNPAVRLLRRQHSPGATRALPARAIRPSSTSASCCPCRPLCPGRAARERRARRTWC